MLFRIVTASLLIGVAVAVGECLPGHGCADMTTCFLDAADMPQCECVDGAIVRPGYMCPAAGVDPAPYTPLYGDGTTGYGTPGGLVGDIKASIGTVDVVDAESEVKKDHGCPKPCDPTSTCVNDDLGFAECQCPDGTKIRPKATCGGPALTFPEKVEGEIIMGEIKVSIGAVDVADAESEIKKDHGCPKQCDPTSTCVNDDLGFAECVCPDGTKIHPKATCGGPGILNPDIGAAASNAGMGVVPAVSVADAESEIKKDHGCPKQCDPTSTCVNDDLGFAECVCPDGTKIHPKATCGGPGILNPDIGVTASNAGTGVVPAVNVADAESEVKKDHGCPKQCDPTSTCVNDDLGFAECLCPDGTKIHPKATCATPARRLLRKTE